MKIAILGAGWYGCHLASILIQYGFKLDIFERSSSIFSGASKKNQNRLHLGFHYPRNFETRRQSCEGFKWFKEHYPAFLDCVMNNYYCIANEKSILDMKTYLQIMDATGLKYEKIENPCIELKSIEGVIRVDEMLVKNDSASKYFSKLLSPYIKFNQPVFFGSSEVRAEFCSQYDYVIDCTWKAASISSTFDIYFEPCIYFYYEKLIDISFALTIMDGKFFSLYPYKNNIYTLTSVVDTPISKNITYIDALREIQSLNSQDIKEKRNSFVKLVETYYPNFSKHFKFHGVEFSVKTKINNNSDFRGSLIEIDENYISVYSGKIDTIHIIEKKILEIIL